jgi:tetratricopeptide (TPR) repeat protein
MENKMMRMTFLLGLSGMVLLLPAADLNKGVALYESGKNGEAVEQLRHVVEAEPDNARAQRYMGLALLGKGDKGAASEHLRKAMELEASGDSKVAMALLHMEEKEYGEAEELLKDASGEDLLYAKGLLAFHRNKHAEAARDLEAFLKEKPGHAYAHYYAGLAYNGLRKPDKMLTHFELFLRMNPDAPEARKVRSVLKTGR